MAHVQDVQPPPTGRFEPGKAGTGASTDLPTIAGESRAARQIAVTIAAEVKPGRLSELRRTLEAMSADPASNAIVPFAALPRTHFARFVLLDATEDPTGEPIEPQLLFMSDVDKPESADSALEHCLGELVDVAGDGLDKLFGACSAYPTPSRATRPRRLAFLREHALAADASYINTVGRSVLQIRREEQLRLAIERFLDLSGIDWQDRTAGEVRGAIQDFVARQEELTWAGDPPPSAALGTRVADALQLVAVPAGLLALSPVLVPALPLFALALRLQEERDPAPHIAPSREHALRLAAQEDHGVQNQLNAVSSGGVGFVKPGIVRRVTTEVVLRGVEFAARHVYNHANLAGVKTIHSARWVFLDDRRRRMIFASNYDGSLESYNDDFVDKLWWGLNAVFSNGIGFPSTRWLFFGGTRQEQPFKDYLRGQLVPSQVWYSAYPDLTALNIENNSRIRVGLHGEMSRAEAEEWLQRI